MENLSLNTEDLSKHLASDSCKEIKQPYTFKSDVIKRSKTPVNVIDDMSIVGREELAQGATQECPVVSPGVLQSSKKFPREGKLVFIIVPLWQHNYIPKNDKG